MYDIKIQKTYYYIWLYIVIYTQLYMDSRLYIYISHQNPLYNHLCSTQYTEKKAWNNHILVTFTVFIMVSRSIWPHDSRRYPAFSLVYAVSLYRYIWLHNITYLESIHICYTYIHRKNWLSADTSNSKLFGTFSYQKKMLKLKGNHPKDGLKLNNLIPL